MNTRARRAYPFYIFLPSSFLCASWHKFCCKPPNTMWAQQPVQCTLQQKNLSLEGYTVSNTGQRLGITGSKKSLAWRAVRPDGLNEKNRLFDPPFWPAFFETLMFMNWFIKKPSICFWTRIVHELNTNWTELMGQLMRQLMGINGETFLAGSAPFWNMNVHELIH